MMVVVSALCCVFALMAALGLLWSVALVILLALVGAHVFGNSLGTRLRDEASRQQARIARSERAPTRPLPRAAPPRLAVRARLTRLAPVVTLCGFAVGGELGGVLSAYTYPEAPTAAVLLGVVSMAVLGGFLGFGAGSFYLVARQALGEALAAQAADQRNGGD
jgi:hypothetical protein